VRNGQRTSIGGERTRRKNRFAISIEEYEKLLVEIEDQEAIREYLEAKAAGEKPAPFDEAIARIERNRM
jgi:hypothetical protein